MRLFCAIILALGLFSSLTAQNSTHQFWAPVPQENIVLPESALRAIQPSALRAFQLNYSALETALQQAPMEFTAAARERALLLDIPMADGSLRTFSVVESPVIAPGLSAKFPAIRTYAGTAADGSGVSVRLGLGYKGFHAFIFDDQNGLQTVRPYAEGEQSFYMAYRMSDVPVDTTSTGQSRCGMDDFDALMQDEMAIEGHHALRERGSQPVQLKVYRLAIAAQGEYSIFHGGTKPLVLSAIVETLNFIDAIYIQDHGLRLELVANNDEIIYLNPDTDPYTDTGVLDWAEQNPAAINPVIGINSYDIGHVFAVYNGGGVLGYGPGRTCLILEKSKGGTSTGSPVGEFFNLVACHEMCHQLSGTHTFSNCPPNSGAVTSFSAFEPGAGSTIMSYTNACGDQNLQSIEDPYFHLINIIQIQNYIAQGNGNLCGQSISTSNNAPVASTNIQPEGLYIPVSTPFVLSGTGEDPDGDALTYCWEQYDLGPTSSLGDPEGDSPTFRSYLPSSSPDRTFPRIQTIISNSPSDVEVLPTYNRLLTFRMTVRDNHPSVGATDWVQVKVRSTTTAGPFLVTYPNELVAWKVGENQIVSWDVANTDGPLVKCKLVNIRLSLNGGLTYPVLLASSVPNTGRYCIQVPNNVTTTARIRVEAADHIFFDISNANFSIQPPQAPDFSICSSSLKEQICLPNAYTTVIATSAIQGFDSPIALTALGLPAGATATFSPNPVQAGSSSTMSIEFAPDQPENTFNVTVQAEAGGTRSYDLILTTVRNDFSEFKLETPVDGASGINISPVLSWKAVPDANVYDVEVATNPSFEAGTLVASAYNVSIDSFDIPSLLNQSQAYYWRVRPENECGLAAWSEPFVFMVQAQTCNTFSATDLPKNISSNGTPTIESKITIPTGGAVSDVNVKKVQGYHDFFGDLEVRLVRPTGGNVLLFKNRCSSYAGNFDIAFDDIANAVFSCPPPQNAAQSKPVESLSAFNGQNAAGEWILRVKDNTPSSGGQMIGFQLELCSSVSLSGPFIVNNNTLQLPSGTNAAITSSLLKTDDANNTADQLTYTLITVPAFGILENNGSAALKAGDQFTQAALDNGAIRYFDYGFNTSTDAFRFAVTDGEGGLASGTFNIQTLVSGTKDLLQNIAFDLAPNPAEESVRISFGEALNTDTHINLFNTAGQLLRSQTLGSGNVTLVMQISDLPQGVYTVLVSNSKATGVRKLVVK